MKVDSVTIPMQKKDDNDNVTMYRVQPLVFSDERYKTIQRHLGRDLRTKFMRLYKRTKDIDGRTPAVEMSSFLASFAFEQLCGWYGVLMEITNDPKMAMLNTFHIFSETFKHLAAEIVENADGGKSMARTCASIAEEEPIRKPDGEGASVGSGATVGAADEIGAEATRRGDVDGAGSGPVHREDALVGSFALPPAGCPVGGSEAPTEDD